MMWQFMEAQLALMTKQDKLRRAEEERRERRRWEREDSLWKEAEEKRLTEWVIDAEEWRALAEQEERLRTEKATKEAMIAEEKAERDEERKLADAGRRKQERLLRTIMKIGEKDDLEVYLDGLEHHLQHCQVEEAEWPMYLTANMTGHYAELVQGLTMDPDEPYTKVRDRLLAPPLRMRD